MTATPKLAILPGTAISPEVLLAQSLERAGEFESILIVSKGKDGTFRCGWSRMTTSDLCFAARVLDRDIDREMGGAAE